MGGRLAWAVGFTGLGVGSTRFAALAALDLLAGRSAGRTALDMVRRGPWLSLLDRFGVGFDT